MLVALRQMLHDLKEALFISFSFFFKLFLDVFGPSDDHHLGVAGHQIHGATHALARIFVERLLTKIHLYNR